MSGNLGYRLLNERDIKRKKVTQPRPVRCKVCGRAFVPTGRRDMCQSCADFIRKKKLEDMGE